MLRGFAADVSLGDLRAPHRQALCQQRGHDQRGDGGDDAHGDDGGQGQIKGLGGRDGIGVGAHDVACTDGAQLRHQHAHLVITRPVGHLQGNGSHGDAGHVAEHAHGGQQPCGQRDGDQAPLGTHLVDDRFGNAFSRTALNERAGQNTCCNDTDDRGDDALRAGDDKANCAGEPGAAYQTANHGAEDHGIGGLYFFQDQHNGDGKGHQRAQNRNGNSIHSRFLLIQITDGRTSSRHPRSRRQPACSTGPASPS